MGRAQAAAAAFAIGMVVAPRVCQAQASGQDVATAQALFDEGKRLMAANNYAEACPKLMESQRLDPGGGTLFAIALCHEGEGKTATAWADYNVALAEARKDGRKDREQAAADKAKALEPKLTKMRIVVAQKVPGLELTRDGALVGDAQWGLPLPIDPGEHVFAAKAPGKIDWTSTVDIRGEGKTVEVSVPVLADAPKPPEPMPETKPTEPRPAVAPPEPVAHGSSTQKTWAVVAGAAGLVSVGVGLGFGLSASAKWGDAEDRCPQNRCQDPRNTSLGDEAGRAADISTVLVTAGGGALVAGIILWLTAPKSEERAVRVLPAMSKDALGLSLGGAL